VAGSRHNPSLLGVHGPTLNMLQKRESFRHRSCIAGIATAQISGLGASGYLAALDTLAQLIA